MIRRTFANLGRLRQITAVIARHGLGHYQERRRGRTAGLSEGEPEGMALLARRFRNILEDLGPTFVKFGQVLSTRADLLPPEFIVALEGLQDHAPPVAWEDVRDVVQHGLGDYPEKLFATLDPAPIASASIAQVHVGTTRDGLKVAVKVQRKDIRHKIISDLDILRYLAQLAEAIIEESGMVTPRGIVDEFEAMLLAELDFGREAENIRRFAANLKAGKRAYVVPSLVDSLSCRTVLTMEYIEGTTLSRLDERHNPKRIAEHIIQTAFEQIFVDGVFHADPHPGNVLILNDNRLGLIDFGSVGVISYAMRETLVALVVAVGTRDADTVARLLYRTGIAEQRVALHELRDACASLFSVYLRDMQVLANIQASQLMSEIFQLAARFRIRIPSEYALIGRAAATIEGILRRLDPSLEVLVTTRPYVRRLVEEQFSAPAVGNEALKRVLRVRTYMRDIPMAASQILMDMEAGRMQVHVQSPSFDAVSRSIEGLAVTLFMAIVAGALIVGSMVMLASYDFRVWGVPVLPVIGFYLASVLFGAAVGRYLLAPRLKKLSVMRFVQRWRRHQGQRS